MWRTFRSNNTLRDGTVTDLPILPESIRLVTVNVTARTNIKDPN